MKISKIILATLVLASLNGAAQNDKPIGCGKKPVKENGKKPTKEPVVKKRFFAKSADQTTSRSLHEMR